MEREDAQKSCLSNIFCFTMWAETQYLTSRCSSKNKINDCAETIIVTILNRIRYAIGAGITSPSGLESRARVRLAGPCHTSTRKSSKRWGLFFFYLFNILQRLEQNQSLPIFHSAVAIKERAPTMASSREGRKHFTLAGRRSSTALFSVHAVQSSP